MKSSGALLAIASLVAWATSGPLLAQEASAKAKGLQAVITTADDEKISAGIISLQDGKLELATEPPRTIALVDIQRVELGKVVSTVAIGSGVSWIGQDNHDLVQVGGANGGNGIQDLHLHADSLKPVALKQIVIVCRLPKQLRVWRLDTSQSPHWRLAIMRGDLATEAEIYLEPAADDSFGQKFDVTFTYNDGTTTQASVTATTHTSDQRAVDKSAQPGQVATAAAPAAAPGTTEIYLADSGRLQGEVTELNLESLTLRTVWKGDIQVPLLRVKGIWFGNAPPTGARADFNKQLAAPISDDVLFVVAPDKTAAKIQGGVQGLSDGKLHLRFDGADRAVNKDRLLGLVLAAHPKIPPVTTPFEMFVFNSGDVISGRWLALSEGQLEIETLWQSRLKLPVSEVGEIRSRNGRLTFLPDLDPLAVEEVPYFGRVIPWRRDQGFDDAPAKVKGKQPTRCLAMHSRSLLTYALDEQFDKFKATLGFDDSAGNRGRALCRVAVDGREVFVQKDLHSDQDPQTVEVSVQGGKQLTLEVDFGEAEDVGDRIIWAEPRLFRAEKK
jgi:hypothetical protein